MIVDPDDKNFHDNDSSADDSYEPPEINPENLMPLTSDFSESSSDE
jgi:hypothetical protein